jgi:hypothetical protein
VAEGANPPKSKFFDAVACLKTSVTELSHPFDQGSQVRCHLRLSPLVLDEQREQMFVRPLRLNVHIDKEPPLGSTFLASFERSLDVVHPAVAIK